MRVFKSFISVNFLEEGWDARDQYLIPVPLEAPIVVLYRKVISACRDPSHHAWRTYLELFQRLGVFNPRASLEAFLSNPPDLVLASCSNASGCHTRAHHLGTHIFVDSDYWSRFETAEDPNNSTCIALSAYTITKVAIVRGLAHCVVSQALGTLDRDLHSLDSSDTVQLSDSEIAEIAEMRARKVAMLETSEQLRLPWKEGNEGKAGEWAEYHLFGGLVTLNSQKRAVLQTGLNIEFPLDDQMLLLSMLVGVVHFPTEFRELAALSTISPSSGTSTTEKKGVEGVLASLPTQKCLGTLHAPQPPNNIELSHEALQRLLMQAREELRSPETV